MSICYSVLSYASILIPLLKICLADAIACSFLTLSAGICCIKWVICVKSICSADLTGFVESNMILADYTTAF